MLQVLLIDDEIHAIEGLCCSVDWKKLGLCSPEFAVTPAKIAEKLSYPYDIIVCDIRMPGQSGLELMERYRQSNTRTAWIFLSAHAEFEYAQRALELGAVSYLLKPCSSATLSEALLKAKEKLVKERKTEDRTYDNSTALIQMFWRDLLHKRIGNTPQVMQEEARKRNIGFLARWTFFPILFSGIQSPVSVFSPSLRQTLEGQICQNLLVQEKRPIQFEFENRLLVILHPHSYQQFSTDWVSAACRQILKDFRQEAGIALCCFVGKEVPPEKMLETIQAMIEMDRENTSGSSQVFLLSQKREKAPSCLFPDVKTVCNLFAEKQYGAALETVKNCARKYELKHHLTIQNLILYEQSYLYCISYYLTQSGKNLQQYMETISPTLLQQNDCPRTHDMFAWLDSVTTQLSIYMGDSSTETELLPKVEEYIQNHLSEPLTRSRIAEAVYLNSDYLGRIFQKKTGMFLSEYITNMRLQKAKSLLETTTLPIAFIATEVGFSSISYFSKQFKAVYGLSPSSFKKQTN